MNKFISKFLILGMILVVFSGCSLFGINPEKDGDKIVQEGIKNLYSVKVADFDGGLKGNILDKVNGDINVDLSFSGSGDIKDPKNILLNLKVDGTGVLGKENENLTGEMKINKSGLYFIVSKMSSFGGLFPEESIKPLLKQWWKTQTPPSTSDSLEKSVVGDDSKLTPQEKKSNELFKNTQFFSGAKYLGEENGAYHYETALDNEAVKTFAKESAKIDGITMTDDELKTLDANLKSTKLKAEIWVGITDKTVHKVKLDLNVDDTATATKFDAVLTAAINNINKPVTVEAPKDAKDFDLNAILGGGDRK